ncbi:cadherin repeat domain-containing protein, partial [Bathymodiolus thermophilus thioautotrophic gill symbiont]
TFNRFIVTTLLVLFASQAFATDTFITTTNQHAQDGTLNTQASLTHQSMTFTSILIGASGNSNTITILGNNSTGCSLSSGRFSSYLVATCGIPIHGGTSTKQNLVDAVDSAIGFNATGGSATALDSDVLLEKANLIGGITGLSEQAQSIYFTPTPASKAGIVYKMTINGINYTHTSTGADSIQTIIGVLQPKINDSNVSCRNDPAGRYILCATNIYGTKGIFTYSSFAFDSTNFNITSTNILNTNEGTNLEHTLTANNPAATFSITEDTSGLFSLRGTHNNTLTFNGTNTDYESTTKSYTVKVKATTGDGDDKNTTQTITVTLVDLNDELPTAITLTGNRTIAENTRTGTELGTLSTTDADTNDTFVYTSSNTKFTIDNDKLKLNATLDYENATSLNTTITVTDGSNHTLDKIFNFTVSDIDDTAPTNILLSNVNLIKDQPANTLVGTLSASDVDTNTPLTFAVNDTTNFKIVNGNELRTNKSITTALGNTININITASDNTNDSAPQPFTIAITTTYIAAPVIAQFTITQGENKGPLISKDGGEVTVSASAGTGTYTWSSADFSNTSTSKTFVFNPQSVNTGTRTITLKVTAGDFSSERVLKLKLVDTYPNGRTDTNGNGISDSKESGNSDNELPAGTNKKITSPGSTRILPG